MEDRCHNSLINWPYQPKQSPSFLLYFCPVLVFLVFLNVLVFLVFCVFTPQILLRASKSHKYQNCTREFCREYQKSFVLSVSILVIIKFLHSFVKRY